MKFSTADIDALVQILTRYYEDILELEQKFQLLVGDHDFRPRIDYFHDAVRAFTSKRQPVRLSVELLAYDVACLRYLQSMPLSSFKPHGQALSAKTGVVKSGPGLVGKAHKPDRDAKERLRELYSQYSVLFAALLKPFADRDYHERVDELNDEVVNLTQIAAECKATGKSNDAHLESLIAHLDDEVLKAQLTQFLKKKKSASKDELKAVLGKLKITAQTIDRNIKSIETAHLNYAMAQLAIFEESKEMVKKMAAHGMNIVGRFVQESMRENKQQMGR